MVQIEEIQWDVGEVPERLMYHWKASRARYYEGMRPRWTREAWTRWGMLVGLSRGSGNLRVYRCAVCRESMALPIAKSHKCPWESQWREFVGLPILPLGRRGHRTTPYRKAIKAAPELVTVEGAVSLDLAKLHVSLQDMQRVQEELRKKTELAIQDQKVTINDSGQAVHTHITRLESDMALLLSASARLLDAIEGEPPLKSEEPPPKPPRRRRFLGIF
jgi:hypothetical protein